MTEKIEDKIEDVKISEKSQQEKPENESSLGSIIEENTKLKEQLAKKDGEIAGLNRKVGELDPKAKQVESLEEKVLRLEKDRAYDNEIKELLTIGLTPEQAKEVADTEGHIEKIKLTSKFSKDIATEDVKKQVLSNVPPAPNPKENVQTVGLSDEEKRIALGQQ